MRILLFILLTMRIASGATYYVDFDGGSDLNAGASGAPFKRCPGDDSATGTAAATTLTAGDTVKFKGGVNYKGQPKLLYSGSVGSRIVYDGNTAGDWGTGKAVIGCADLTGTYYAFQDSGVARSNLAFSNFEFRMPASNRVGRVAFYLRTGSQDIDITNCFFNYIGFASNVAGVAAADINGTAIYLGNTRRVLVADSEFTGMSRGVHIRGDSGTVPISNIMVSNCNFHNNMVWLVDLASASVNATITNINICYNQFHDWNEFNSGCWAGTGEKPHADGVYLRADGAGGASRWGNINIFGNSFSNSPTSCSGGTADIFIVGGPSCNIYNNLWLNSIESDASISIDHQKQAEGDQIVRIYNNTFFANSRSLFLSKWSPSSERQVYIENNIFYMQNSGNSSAVFCNIEDASNIASLDFNLYYDTGGGPIGFIESYCDWGCMLARGYETHGIYADPRFIEAGHLLNTEPLSNNLRLRSSSPAVGKAKNLGAWFSTDKNGFFRSSWDIGAFTYSAGGGGGSSGRAFSSQVGGRSVTFGGKVELR